MVKWLLAIAVVILAVVFVSFGWGGGKGPALNVVGSTSVQPFAEMLAQAFEESHPGQVVDVQGGGSTAGLQAVRSDPAAIGYMSLGLVGTEVKAVSVDGVPPTSENAATGRYPLIRPLLFVTRGRPSPRAQAFIDFVLSPEGQQMLQKEGLVGAK